MKIPGKRPMTRAKKVNRTRLIKGPTKGPTKIPRPRKSSRPRKELGKHVDLGENI